MLLVVDVGNTNTVFGAADPASGALMATWRVDSSRDRMADEWYALLTELSRTSGFDFREVQSAIVATVVPAISRQLLPALRDRAGIQTIVVSVQLELGISIAVEAPTEVGADRLVNAAYGFHAYGGPLIIVDLGTATKIEAVTKSGDYLGGVIAPGLGLSLDALASRAARLYAVEIAPPPAAIGRNTVHAVQSGIVLGHAAMIEGMVTRVQNEMGETNRVVLTGGYAGAIGALCPSITDARPDLTLAGLHYLWSRNRECAS